MSTCKHCGSPKPPGLLGRKLDQLDPHEIAGFSALLVFVLGCLALAAAFAAYQFREQNARFERERVAPAAGVEAGGK